MIAQVVLLATLAVTVGLGAAGWLAGVGYGLVICAALSRGLAQAGAGALGPADRVTLTRATLVGGVTALTADSMTAGSMTAGSMTADAMAAGTFHRQVPVGLLVGLAAVALVLDAVDGRVARRTGTVSALGARFDMEVDAFLLLVLGGYLAGATGGWVLSTAALSIGAMRYAFVAVGRVLPWMRGTLPPRYWRKVVAATQGIVLAVAAAGVLPVPLTDAVLVTSLALLVESFGRDVAWLWRHRTVRAAHRQPGRSPWIAPRPRPADRTAARPTSHRAVERAA